MARTSGPFVPLSIDVRPPLAPPPPAVASDYSPATTAKFLVAARDFIWSCFPAATNSSCQAYCNGCAMHEQTLVARYSMSFVDGIAGIRHREMFRRRNMFAAHGQLADYSRTGRRHEAKRRGDRAEKPDAGGLADKSTGCEVRSIAAVGHSVHCVARLRRIPPGLRRLAQSLDWQGLRRDSHDASNGCRYKQTFSRGHPADKFTASGSLIHIYADTNVKSFRLSLFPAHNRQQRACATIAAPMTRM